MGERRSSIHSFTGPTRPGGDGRPPFWAVAFPDFVVFFAAPRLDAGLRFFTSDFLVAISRGKLICRKASEAVVACRYSRILTNARSSTTPPPSTSNWLIASEIESQPRA